MALVRRWTIRSIRRPRRGSPRRLIDSLYTEAMLLADEARSYFDDAGRGDRVSLEPFVRVGFACESLKVTTRIMHIVAWLLTQRAIETGEIPGQEGRRPERRLGHAGESDPELVAQAASRRPTPDRGQRRALRSNQAHRRRRCHGGTRRQPCARADGSARARPWWESRLTDASLRSMRSFTFHPGPRLMAGAGKSEAIRDLLPEGPVSVRDGRTAGRTRARRLQPPGARSIGPACRPYSIRSRPTRPGQRWKLRLRPEAPLARGPSSGSAAGARWMWRSSPPICSAPATIWTTSGASTSQRASGCRWCSFRPPRAPAPKRRRFR